MFASIGGKETVVGIHAAVLGTPCGTASTYDTRVDLFASFVDAMIAAGEAPVSDAGTEAAAEDDAGDPPASSSPSSVSSGGCAIRSKGEPTTAGSGLALLACVGTSVVRRRRRRRST
jgi:hypothetical protein